MRAILVLFLLFITSVFGQTQQYYCGDNFYDSGGVDGNYTRGVYRSAIRPSDGFHQTTVTFSSFHLTDDYGDILAIYDGPSDTYPLIGVFNGDSNPGIITSTHASGVLYFKHNVRLANGGDVGWEATVSCSAFSCPKPYNPTITEVTDDAVNISWYAGGSESNWEVEYGPSGFLHGEGTSVFTGTNSLNISGLDQLVDYDIYVRAVCNVIVGLDDSEWTDSLTFFLCGTYQAPYFDDVEGHTGTRDRNIGARTQDKEKCWDSNSSHWYYGWNIADADLPPTNQGLEYGPSGAYSGNNYFYIGFDLYPETAYQTELISPIINISALNNPELSFYYHIYGEGSSDFHVDVYNNNEWTNDVFTLIGQQQTSNDADWIQAIIDLDAFHGDIQFRFRCDNPQSNGFYGFTAVDDISINEALTCTRPQDIVISNIGAHSVDISWQADASQSIWEIEYGANGFTPGLGTFVQSNSPFFNVIGLDSYTDYDFYVRTICGSIPGENDSEWVGTFSFKTLSDYCGGDHFYDVAGPEEDYNEVDYGGYENHIVTIYPVDYERVSVHFNSFDIGDDYFRFYDGDSNSFDNFVRTYYGTDDIGTLTSTHPSGALTFVLFRPYHGNSTNPGWDATVTCENFCDVPFGVDFEVLDSDSVLVNWEVGDSETNWQIEYGESGFIQGTGMLIDTTSNPFELNGLDANLHYDVYIRANCNFIQDNLNSDWIGPETFNILDLLSVEDFYFKEVILHPNPVSDVLYLENIPIHSTVILYSIFGQELLTIKANETNLKMPLSGYNSGIYFVTIHSKDNTQTHKIVKK